MENYETVVEAITGLKGRGYELDFNISENHLACAEKDIRLHPDEFEIMEMYRFEGSTDPEDEDIVYAIRSKDGHTKGILTSAFGPYADTASEELIRKLNWHQK